MPMRPPPPAAASVAPGGAWLGRHWRRIAQVGAGHGLYATFNWGFDNVLYVYVVYTFGILKGGVCMLLLSCLQCAATLLVYQRMGIDWVGAGLLAELRRKERRSRLQNLIVRASARSEALIFVLLCVFQDPFITTAYFKQGQFGALTVRDWRIFFGSVFVANLYWIFVAALIGQAVAVAWRWLSGLL